MKILIVDNGTSYLRALLQLLVPHEVRTISWKDFSPDNIFPSEIIILSGGHSLSVLNHDYEYRNEIEIIKNAAYPIIGICLGFELIAHTFGAELQLLPKKEKGLIRLKAVQPNPMHLYIPEADVYESHRWAVKTISKPLIGLAVSRDGYEIIAHEAKPIIGLQFHPEMFTDITVGDEIMNTVLRWIGNAILT